VAPLICWRMSHGTEGPWRKRARPGRPSGRSPDQGNGRDWGFVQEGLFLEGSKPTGSPRWFDEQSTGWQSGRGKKSPDQETAEAQGLMRDVDR
jgi:hypothetical protein